MDPLDEQPSFSVYDLCEIEGGELLSGAFVPRFAAVGK